MATDTLTGGIRPVITPNQFPPAAAALLAARLLDRHSAHEIAEAIEVLVDVLDMLGGDPDVERNGDELDGNSSEDDFMDHSESWQGRPGCPIADPDSAIDDGPCDDVGMDLEADDDLCPDYALDQSEALPSAMVVQHDSQGIRQHRDRIRRTRCDKVIRFGYPEFALRD